MPMQPDTSNITKYINKYGRNYRIVDAEFGEHYEVQDADLASSNTILKLPAYFSNAQYSFKVYFQHDEYVSVSGSQTPIPHTVTNSYGFTWDSGCVYTENELVTFIKENLRYVYYMAAQHITNELLQLLNSENNDSGNSGSGGMKNVQAQGLEFGNGHYMLPADLGIDERQFFLVDVEEINRDLLNNVLNEIANDYRFCYDKTLLFNYIRNDSRFGNVTNDEIWSFVNRYTDFYSLIDGKITPTVFSSLYNDELANEISAAVGLARLNMTNDVASILVSNSSRLTNIKNSISNTRVMLSNSSSPRVTLHSGAQISDSNKITKLRQLRTSFLSNSTIDVSTVSALLGSLQDNSVQMSQVNAQYFVANLLAEAASNNLLPRATLNAVISNNLLSEVDPNTIAVISRRPRL